MYCVSVYQIFVVNIWVTRWHYWCTAALSDQTVA